LPLKQFADVAERSPERVERSGLGLAQVCLDLGKGFLILSLSKDQLD
jgi:hypothetical protein